jgi:predicted heme/steroid binding protein
MFYKNLLNSEIRKFNESQWYYMQTVNLRNQENETIQSEQREFTLEELAEYDGSGGRPAYVAVNGIVYDVSLEATWGGSTHFNLYAGKDLTAQFNGCHEGNLEVLRNLPQVGIIQE